MPRAADNDAKKRHSSQSITRLLIRNNGIGDGGAEILAQALPQSRLLFEFSLAGNHIGNKGVIAIARALAQTRTKFLELMNNQIGDRGAIALAKAFLSAVRKRLVCPALVSFLLGRFFSFTGVTCRFQGLRRTPWESSGKSRRGSMVVPIERSMGVSVSSSMCISIGYSTGGSMGCYVDFSMNNTIGSCASSFMGDYAGHYVGGYKGSRTGASIGSFMRGCRSIFGFSLQTTRFAKPTTRASTHPSTY